MKPSQIFDAAASAFESNERGGFQGNKWSGPDGVHFACTIPAEKGPGNFVVDVLVEIIPSTPTKSHTKITGKIDDQTYPVNFEIADRFATLCATEIAAVELATEP